MKACTYTIENKQRDLLPSFANTDENTDFFNKQTIKLQETVDS